MQNWNMGINLGCANMRAVTPEDGIIMMQSSAVSLKGNAPVGVGDDALSLLGRTSKAITTVFPMKNGIPAEEKALRAWLQRLLRESNRKARVLLACAPFILPAAKRAYGAIAMECGAADCAFIRSDVLNAIGAGLAVENAECCMCVDVGAGQITCTAFAAGNVIACDSVPFGLSDSNDLIIRAVRADCKLAIGPLEAEECKKTLSGLENVKYSTQGVDIETGFPVLRDIPSDIVKKASEPVLTAVERVCRNTVQALSPQCAEDILNSGIALTGGGSLLHNLDQRISEACGVKCFIPENAENAAAFGFIRVFKDIERYESFIEPISRITKA